MTKLLEQAIDAARRLAPDEQDDIALVILQLAGIEGYQPHRLTNAESASIDKSKQAAECGEFASEDDVRAVWAKHGL